MISKPLAQFALPDENQAKTKMVTKSGPTAGTDTLKQAWANVASCEPILALVPDQPGFQSYFSDRRLSAVPSYPARWPFSFIFGPLNWSSKEHRNIVQLCISCQLAQVTGHKLVWPEFGDSDRDTHANMVPCRPERLQRVRGFRWWLWPSKSEGVCINSLGIITKNILFQ